MKKIGTLTFHRALNYGAVLQTYALIKAMQKQHNNISVEVIDYRAKVIENNRSIKSRLVKPSVKNIIRTAYLILKKKKFDKFVKLNIPTSKIIYDKNNLELIDENYDCVIVGSDQVWNYKITNSDYTYLLDFEAKKGKKFSYAASLGLNEICNEEKGNYKKRLNDFCEISVRENNCREILEKDLNIKVNDVHLDPTLLLDGDDWAKLTKKNKYGKYILIYNVPKPNKLYKIAEEISNQTGYKIISIPNGINPKNCKIARPDVNQFLSLFAHAEYIVTNSFHGTVFSIQFHKKFIVELQNNGHGNDRITTLLSTCQLTSHILKEKNADIIYENIDWNKVENELKKARNNSINYLNKIVDNTYLK